MITRCGAAKPVRADSVLRLGRLSDAQAAVVCLDMCVLQGQAWVPWLDTIPEFKCDPSKPFSQIFVPTTDTVRYTYVVDALTAAGKHVLCVGETGTGKTLTLMTKLLEGMPPEVQPVFITFSARTSANQTQDIIGEHAATTHIPLELWHHT